MSRDVLFQTILLKFPSNLTLNTSRDGTSPVFLDNPFQCLTTPSLQNFFMIINPKLTSFCLKPLHPVPCTGPCKKTPTPSLLQPLQVLKGALSFFRGISFSRLNNPSFLSLSSQVRCTSPLIIFVASSVLPASQCVPCAVDPRA